MKILIAFIELITSPFTYLLKRASGKNYLFPLGKVISIALISLVIVAGLVFLFYWEHIFK